MNVLCIDDELLALEALQDSVDEALPGSEIFAFRNSEEAMALARQNSIDVAFLDIEMREINGIQLAKQLKELSKTTIIIFVTGHDNYALDAFGVSASGYLLKPISPQSVKKVMENLWNTIASIHHVSALRAQCFGNFEVFFGEKPIKFKYNKTKELLAYLIDRKGAICTNGELATILWEDEAGGKKSYLSNITSDLIKTLEELGAKGVVMKRRGSLYIVPEKLNCDFYDWNKGRLYAINAYCGEYMSQYSWAEMTLGMMSGK